MIKPLPSSTDGSQDRFDCMLAMLSISSPHSPDGDQRSILCRVLDGREMEGVRTEDLAILSPDEQGHYARLQNPREHALHCRARAELRRMLGRELGMAPQHVPIIPDHHGKPRCPHPAAADLDFSVSHAGDCAIIALGEAAGIGVDVEFLGDQMPGWTLLEAVFHKQELDQWPNIPVEKRCAAFAEAWVIKEAALKAVGTGLDGSPQEVRVRFDANGHAWPVFWSRLWIFERIHVSSQYAACVVAVMPQEELPRHLIAA